MEITKLELFKIEEYFVIGHGSKQLLTSLQF
jgi:hypothetical protein